ncbi:hypothetical protein [Streptomyces fructofermentans]|uniref:hypothetical protein n=1 Tax=Streptomyces fructofermentans TaxID=152141 RepID=UPI0033F33C41
MVLAKLGFQPAIPAIPLSPQRSRVDPRAAGVNFGRPVMRADRASPLPWHNGCVREYDRKRIGGQACRRTTAETEHTAVPYDPQEQVRILLQA